MERCPNCGSISEPSTRPGHCEKCRESFSSTETDKTDDFASSSDASVLDTADFAESTAQSANDQTVDVLEKSETEGTADFSVDDIDKSTCATVHIDVSGLTVRKTATSDLGIGPFPGATHLPNSDETSSGDTNKYANFTSNANRASVSKRTLSQDTSSLSVPADYQVIKKLGEGGMGVVYSAIQRNLDRTVAV